MRLGLYNRLPPVAQSVAVSLEGWRLERERYGPGFREVLADLEERNTWSAAQLEDFRDARIRAFVHHAVQTVPYYRNLFERLGAHPADIAGLSDLAALPILTKAQIQDDPDAFRSTAVPRKRTRPIKTSGTTGAGLPGWLTRDAVREQWAVWWRYRRWHGIQFHEWCAYFAARPIVPPNRQKPPYWRYNIPGRQLYFSANRLTPTTAAAYAGRVTEAPARMDPRLPVVHRALRSYVVDQKLDLGYQVRWITTGAENLSRSQADVIEAAFGVRPRQSYGMAEAVANFSECDRGRLHVDEDFAAVEFVPRHDGQTAVVGTNLANLANPLIRYDVGDLATLGTACDCGRPGRIVDGVDGRQEDYIERPDGSRVARLDGIFKVQFRVREAQLVQRDLTAITVRIVRAPGFSADDERLIRTEVAARLGTDMAVHIDYCDSIARSPSGKLRFVVSELGTAGGPQRGA